jgi:hypothetical protein
LLDVDIAESLRHVEKETRQASAAAEQIEKDSVIIEKEKAAARELCKFHVMCSRHFCLKSLE